MGNRTYLEIGDSCEFEANNCIPVNWLALFQSNEFIVDEVNEEDDDEREDDELEGHIVAVYQTTVFKAKQRVSSLISKIKGHSPAWKYLKPLEIIMDEINSCSDEDVIQMDLTQFFILNEHYGTWVKTIVADFQKVTLKFLGDETDEKLIGTFINYLLDPFINSPIKSLKNLSSEEKMFILVGFYDSSVGVEKYPLSYFNDAYWAEI